LRAIAVMGEGAVVGVGTICERDILKVGRECSVCLSLSAFRPTKLGEQIVLLLVYMFYARPTRRESEYICEGF
jgi:hypothetical protein